MILERLPQFFVLLMAAVGVFGIGSYWRSADKPLNIASKQFLPSPAKTDKKSGDDSAPADKNLNISPPPTGPTSNKGQTAPPVPIKPPRPESAPAAAFCGAPTKKGTPCSRRVKGSGRCWQHEAETALLPPEKPTAR